MTRIKNKLENLGKAFARLKEVSDLPMDRHKTQLEATIQCFEYTVELVWKSLKVILEEERFDFSPSPKKILQKAYQLDWLENEKTWIEMIDDRNLSVHVYDEKIIEEIYNRIKNQYVKEIESLYNKLYDEYYEQAE